MTVLENYRALVANGVITADPAQAHVAAQLDKLAKQLRALAATRGPFRVAQRHRAGAEGALYFWPRRPRQDHADGPVLAGDDVSPEAPPAFSRVHGRGARAHRRGAQESSPAIPSRTSPRRIAAKSALLCFDELHVTDIADAMILGRLFRALFEAQVVVVATSNVAPGELYKNGLNRALFLPFIDLIGQHMEVEELLAAKDFRLDKLVGKPLYFTPADARARAEMDRLWGELTGNHPGAPADLEVKGRKRARAAGIHGRGALRVCRAVRRAAGGQRFPAHRPRLPHRDDRRAFPCSHRRRAT